MGRHRGHPKEKLRRALPVITAAAGFLLTYFMFSATFPSTYAGTQFSWSIPEALNCLSRQTASCVPGFELLTKRTFMGSSGPFWRTPAEIVQLFRNLEWPAMAVAALQAAATAIMMTRITRSSFSMTWSKIAMGGALIFLPNLLISFTEKYQITAYQRMFPYVYSYYAYLAVGFVALAFFFRLYRLLPNPGARRLGLIAAISLATLVYFSAQAANAHTLGLLAAASNP